MNNKAVLTIEEVIKLEMNRKIKKTLMLSLVVLLLFVLACAPKTVRHISEKDFVGICASALPEYPLVARVGVRLKEYGEDKGAVAGLLFIRDRETFKIVLLGPFGSQKGEVYFLRGRVVAYRGREKVLDMLIPIRALPEGREFLKNPRAVSDAQGPLLASGVEGMSLTCRVSEDTMRFQSIHLKKGTTEMVLEGFKDGFYRRVIISDGGDMLEIKVRDVRHRRQLKEDIFQLP